MAEAVQEAQSEAAEYDAWFRRKVQEALDETEVFTSEAVEAENEAWCAEVLRQMAAEVRRTAGEVGLDALSGG
jgi:polyhydroxyalkanoate synthesis regulator phasin